jgi:hypothetical protein
MKMSIAIKRFVANKMKDICLVYHSKKNKICTYYNSNHLLFLPRLLQMFIILQVRYRSTSIGCDMYKLIFLTHRHQLFYVLDTHDSSINKHFSLSICMINSIHIRSCRTISCNNTSRRYYKRTTDDDDNEQV